MDYSTRVHVLVRFEGLECTRPVVCTGVADMCLGNDYFSTLEYNRWDCPLWSPVVHWTCLVPMFSVQNLSSGRLVEWLALYILVYLAI
jgi:hypothetical protein